MNEKIIKILEKLVKMYEKVLHTLNNQEKNIFGFKIKAIKNGINIIKNFKKEIKNADELNGIYGIGKGIMKRVDEIIKTRSLKEIDVIENIVSHDSKQELIDKLKKIIGIGEINAEKLIEKHNIKSIEDLKEKVNNKKIEVTKDINIGLKYFKQFQEMIPRNEIKYIKNIINNIKDDNLKIKICGSFRRKKKVSGDIDILICNKKIISDYDFNKTQLLNDVINKIKLKLLKHDITMLDLTYKEPNRIYMGYLKYTYENNEKVRRIDINIVPYESYYLSLLYLTGSKDHNIYMRKIAKKMGYRLSQYYLYDINKNKKIKINSEKDIFDILNIPFVKPEYRDI